MIQMTKSGMKKFKAKSLYGALLAGGMMNSEAATSFYFEALTPYLGFNDSPFKPLVDAGEFENWVFEDFQDNTVSFPAGVAVSGYTIFSGGIGSLSDSVEFTGDVLTGRSLFGSGVFAMSFEEGPGNLSALPTHAGLVCTDGQTSLITFEAFDRDGNSLGTVSGNHADGSIFGTTGEDRFYGVFHSEGISRITINSSGAAQELDHLQFGSASSVPEPGVALLGLVSVMGFLGRRSRPR